MEHAELSRERFGRSSPFDLVNAVDLWLATGIGLLAAGLRLYGLGRKPLWYDEAFSVFIARQPLGRIGSLVAVNDAHPPLYYYVLHQWVGAFGSSELAVRGLSAVLGIAAAILTYAFVNGLRANRGEAGLAAALVAVSPLQILHSQEARMYPLLTVLVVLSWMALRHGIQRPNLISWALYVLFTTLMLYSHYYGFLVLGSQALCVLILPKARRLAGSWAMSAGVAAVLYIPWLPALLWQLQSGRGWPFYRIPLTPSLFADVLSVVVSGRPMFNAPIEFVEVSFLGLTGLPLLGLAVAFVGVGVYSFRRNAEVVVLLSTALVGPVILALILSLFHNIVAVRYFTFLVPFYAALLGAGLLFMGRLGKRPGVAVSVVAAAVILAGAIPSLVPYYARTTLDPFDWRAAADVLNREARPDDLVLFLPGFSSVPVSYYFRGESQRIALTPQGAEVEGPQAIRTEDVGRRIRQSPRTWIVMTKPFPGQALSRLEGFMRMETKRSVRVENKRALLVLYSDSGGK